jgi:hypothetical protein
MRSNDQAGNKPMGIGAYDCDEVAAQRAAPLAGRQVPSTQEEESGQKFQIFW